MDIDTTTDFGPITDNGLLGINIQTFQGETGVMWAQKFYVL
jgi:hypothetical protein